MSKDCTIQDVFHRFYPSFESTHSISPAQRKTAYHIMNCKTGAFGVNVSVCEDCGCMSVHYNSCRDRCCPMCQEFPKEKWVDEYYPMLAKVLFEVAVKLQKETGVHIKFINLSGGVGIPYKPDQEPNDIRAIGDGVRRVYEEVLVPAGMGDVAIYTEMGRFMMGPYGCLVTTAIHEKHTHKEYIGVDACAVNLMRPAMYGAYHHITVMGKENAPCNHKYDITGSLCENNDKFAIDRMLPKIDIGDVLVIHDTGAHGFSMGYNYNGKLKSAEVLLKEDGTTQLIRRAETPADYFATFDCFDIGKKLIEK